MMLIEKLMMLVDIDQFSYQVDSAPLNGSLALLVNNSFNNKKPMDQLNQPQFPVRPPMNMNMPAGMNTQPAPMIQPPFTPGYSNMRPGSNYPNEQDEKKKEFARGIFISGFEKCVTTAMIQRHFNIKPINGLKHPMTKLKESKGFAFIYYGSEDDALYVKKTLDRTAILRDKVRITRTVISENLSKMMFKLKTHGFSEKEIQENETKYFNDENLEKEVERMIQPLFGSTVEVNKISIPRGKTDKKQLRYARVFFYVSDVKEAKNIAERNIKASDFGYLTEGKNQYEIILNSISLRINADDTFGQYAKSEIYEYTKKNQSNVLHLKGVKNIPNEDPTALAEEIKEFMNKQGPQWNIVNAYSSIYENRGAWANLTFSTYEETIQAYEHLKTMRPKFRDSVLYGSLRNVKDPRTVVISVVRSDITEKDIEKFLLELSAKSVKTVIPGEEPIRKYDFFSFNIIESKKFFKIDGDETKGVTETEKDQIHPSWIEINEVPRRLIIHFFHDFTDEDIKELNNDITVTPGYETIFLKGDRNRQLRSNHQKGHVNKDGIYIKHTEIKGKKKPRAPKTDKPTRKPMDPNSRPNNNGNNRPNFTRPIEFSTGGVNQNRQPPRMANNSFNQAGHNYRLPAVGAAGGLGNNPNLRHNFNPVQPFIGGAPNMPTSNMPNMPTSNMPNMPTSNMPNMPTSNMPNMPASNMPPMPTSNMPPMGGFRAPGGFPNQMGGIPAVGGLPNMPPMGMPPGPRSMMPPGAPMPGMSPFPPTPNLPKPTQQPPSTE